MKLLIITRKVDQSDERAGFFIDWLRVFAKNFNQLYVICQEKGREVDLPKNVEIYSLGKEKGYGRIRQFILFHCFIVSLLKKVDGVFSHMMPVYAVVAGPWCRIYGKKLVQWYTHKKVNLMLRLASFWVDEFVTASVESFRMKTRRPVKIFGHGIDIGKFQNPNVKCQINDKIQNPKFIILAVSRISPVKNIDLIIKTAENIKLNEPELREKVLFQIIGGPGLLEQAGYMKELEREVHEKNLDGMVDFLGPLPQNEVIPYYQNCDLFVNFSETGSVDKVVLEAMAAGKLVLTSNIAFKKILPMELFLEKNEANLLVEKIKEIGLMPEERRVKLQNVLRQEVEENHNLEKLIKKIAKLYE
jgi:glycosyltransferase involved in cell wall biosynthesis